MIDYAQVSAVAAVVRTGSFDKAAQQLGVTPSAVSQRVKQLEERMGTVLVVRGQPCTATSAGRRLCRHADEVTLLENVMQSDLGADRSHDRLPTVRIAINADSLATWFIDAMAATDGWLFDLVLDDQDHSAEWLRRGEVSAAVCAHKRPVQGCDSVAIGALRYVATATPAFVERWFPDGPNAPSFERAPSITFNAKDELQAEWIHAVLGHRVAVPTHWLPASQAFIDAAVAGVGWGMNPHCLVAEHLVAGRLTELVPERPLDVALYWQCSRLMARSLQDVTQAVRRAADRWLEAPE